MAASLSAFTRFLAALLSFLALPSPSPEEYRHGHTVAHGATFLPYRQQQFIHAVCCFTAAAQSLISTTYFDGLEVVDLEGQPSDMA